MYIYFLNDQNEWKEQEKQLPEPRIFAQLRDGESYRINDAGGIVSVRALWEVSQGESHDEVEKLRGKKLTEEDVVYTPRLQADIASYGTCNFEAVWAT